MEDDNVFGAEGIVIHGDKIVLGMQKPKRWYQLENGETATIVKTLGGAVEEEDNQNTRNALIREILEEIEGIQPNDMKVSQNPIFTKEIKMGELNPYEKNSNLKMKADFYVVEISGSSHLSPNDLPALVEIPIERFCKMDLSSDSPFWYIKNYMVKREQELEIPEKYAIMAPTEIKDFLRQRGDEER